MSVSWTSVIAARHAAWSNFCRTGDPHFLRELPDKVAASWRRCYEHGVDPGTRSLPYDVQRPLPQDQETQRLLRTALPILAPLKDDLSSASILLLLADKSGRVIHQEGDLEVFPAGDKTSDLLGLLAAEELVGTNGCGTALFLQDLMPVDLYEHFCEGFFEWADVGVPLVHPVSREVLGAIDVGLYQKPLTPELVLLARTTASSIQSRLLEYEKTLRHLLLEQFVHKTQRHAVPALAVDRNGIVVAATPAFAQWLKVAPEQLYGHSLSFLPQLGQATRETMASHEPREIVLSVSRSDRLGKVSIEPVRQDGETVGGLLFLSSPQAPVRPTSRKSGEISLWTARYTFADLIGEDAHFQTALDLAKRVAPTNLPVLLQGETGTGKELLAHALHNLSPRRGGPFVAVNCGVIPQDLIASELFGYEKGAFTGASTSGKRGKMELADGGTIFLDEITETSPALQVSLLRALQDHEIVPVGAEHAIKIDVRVIAATNRNVQELLQEGLLRRDLYYRLTGIAITLPPLRTRPQDIPLLADHFLNEERVRKTLSAETLDILKQYPWPGNVRELQTVLQVAALMAEGPVIQVADLPIEVRTTSAKIRRSADEPGTPASLKEVELQAVMDALRSTHGNIKQTAKVLGIARSSLYYKLNEFGLTRTWAQDKQGEEET